MGWELMPGSQWRHDLCQAGTDFGGPALGQSADGFRPRRIDTFMTYVTVLRAALRYVGHRSNTPEGKS